MKTLKYISILTVMAIMLSCEEQDCLDLNDSPIVESCTDNIILMQGFLDENNALIYSLDQLAKPLEAPLTYTNVRSDAQPNTFGLFDTPTNYDAFNPSNNRYFKFFPEKGIMYNYELASATRQAITIETLLAPVVNSNVLYALEITSSPGNTINYNIVSVDQNTGASAVLLSDSFTRLSPFFGENISSANDLNGNLFFIGGSNLLQYNISSNTSTHFELEPNWNQTEHFVNHRGIEVRENGTILVIRSVGPNSVIEPGGSLTISEYSVSDPLSGPTTVFDLNANSIFFNPEFYSSTYDPCDDTYYFTTRTPQNNLILKIDLNNLSVLQDSNSNYLFGIETTNQ